MTFEERFWARVDMSAGLFGCWPWTRARDGDGYGMTWFEGRMHRAHRIAFRLVGRSMGGHPELDHLCRNRGCVNPAHLEPVSRRTNILRGESPCARNARKTHCVNGHPFDSTNTRIGWMGFRQCRACDRARYHRRASDSQGDAQPGIPGRLPVALSPDGRRAVTARPGAG